MQTNLLKALLHLRQIDDFSLRNHYSSSNRMNHMGVALEYFVKDAFCNSLYIQGADEKDKEHSKYFSYSGNEKNPPDFLIRGGDAVEVKKLERSLSGLALNSSYPKSRLYADSPMISQACRQAEAWEARDIIYAVGVVPHTTLELLWFVYGDCYAADREVYERERQRIIGTLDAIYDVDYPRPATRELGRINRVDPLGITYLRIRGMWHMEGPVKVFAYLGLDRHRAPSIAALMRAEKYFTFSESDRKPLEESGLVRDVEIKDPDNPANYLKAKVIEL
jgi:NgoPII restriction endonuclease